LLSEDSPIALDLSPLEQSRSTYENIANRKGINYTGTNFHPRKVFKGGKQNYGIMLDLLESQTFFEHVHFGGRRTSTGNLRHLEQSSH
jgi:hypothetical protein